MMMPPLLSASDSASDDLPLAVGPAMSATKGRSSGRVSMLIATLIAAGELKAGDLSAARDAVATAGGTAGAAGGLAMGKAADIAISGLDRQAAGAAREGNARATRRDRGCRYVKRR